MIKLIGFQYRKRYGLHAMERRMIMKDYTKVSIPQAVRIACNKAITAFQAQRDEVSIPQAVRIACNHLREPPSLPCDGKFQYRKRYGLHAILSPEALGNSEPKRWFSNTPSLFALFPKPQGIFLSQKAAQKGCEASNTKETFIHEENLKLMAISRKSRTSL